MNHINVQKISDFKPIIESTIYITNSTKFIDEEIKHNMWVLSFSNVFAQKLTVTNLSHFTDCLIAQRLEQLRHFKPSKSAIFYLWFDEQALQLRFNLISNCHASLPFGCLLNQHSSYQPILEKFLNSVHAVAKKDDPITIFELNNDDIEEDEAPYILDVFTTNLKGS